MAEQSEIQWLEGEAKDGKSVEKICPQRHIRQNQWQSEWNEMYLNDGSRYSYDYISDYDCIFNDPVNLYHEQDLTRWDALQQLKQQGTKIPINNLAHFTRPESAVDIVDSGGFGGGEKKINEDAQGDDIIAKFSWWSPVFTGDDILKVRETLGGALEHFIEPQRDNLGTLQDQFATSDAFKPNRNRYGSSYFKYDIDDLFDYYGKHFEGEVQFKILGTFGYKVEVMHAVLVCSQANAAGMFRAYPEVPLPPELDEPKPVVTARDPRFQWRPQATGTEIKRLRRYGQPYPLYRRWEHVAFAFHIPDEWEENGKLMGVPELRDHLHYL